MGIFTFFSIKNQMANNDFGQCMSSVRAECAGLTIPETADGLKDYVEEIVATGTFLLKMALVTSAQSMSKNMKRGMNALRCAFSSGFINVYLLVISGWYACAEFGCQADLIKMIQESVPYMCTCTRDAEYLNEQMGASVEDNKMFRTCK